jgi:hypothetical protein
MVMYTWDQQRRSNMPCACNGEGAPKPMEATYEVKYPNGEKKFVTGEHAAKVAVTMGPSGTTYSKA